MWCACRKRNVRTNNFPSWRYAAGYYCVYHGEKSYNGVAILSKTKPRDVRSSLCDEVDDAQARVIAATIGQCASVFDLRAERPGGRFAGV